jgi:O-succinylbenzoic acid--CoA ligase
MIFTTSKKHWIGDRANKYPNECFIIAPEEKLSYNEFYNNCLFVKNILLQNGIRENNHVGILFSHNYNFFVIVNALWLIGAIPVPFNTRNTKSEIGYQLKLAVIKNLIIDKKLEQEFHFQNVKLIIHDSKPCLPADRFTTQHPKFEFHNLKSKILTTKYSILNTALIMFTSGSIGKPKAVVHTFKSLVESVKTTDSFSPLSKKNIWLASLPLYHIGGFMILCRSLISGSKVVFPHSPKYKDVKKAIEVSNPTHISLVPSVLKQFLKNSINPNKSIKHVFVGGGPIDSDLCLSAAKRNWPIVNVYGSTETCSMVTALETKKFFTNGCSVGKAIGKNKIKIMSLPAVILAGKITYEDKYSIGEILVKSNSLFKEYYNDAITTTNSLKNGWYYSGDFGWINKNGFLYVGSRREDLIITGGENVSVQEIQNAILEIPFVKDAYVFGIPDKKWGQKVCAAVVLKNNAEKNLTSSLRTKLAGYKIPKQFYIVKNIPKNEMGKIKRLELFNQLKISLS